MITKDVYTYCIGEQGTLAYTMCIFKSKPYHVYTGRKYELKFKPTDGDVSILDINILYSTAIVKNNIFYIYTVTRTGELYSYLMKEAGLIIKKQKIIDNMYGNHLSTCFYDNNHYLMVQTLDYSFKLFKSTDPLFATSQKIYTRTQLNGFKYYQKPNIDYHPILDKIAITAELVYKGKQENIDLFYTYA